MDSLYVKMIIAAWEAQNNRVDKLILSLGDEVLQTPTAPGRNTGYYLIGHLAAVNDAMLPLLGFGDKLYPQLSKIFLESPESAALEKPTLNEIKEYWKNINARLTSAIHSLTPDEWLTRHNAVSPEDFAKDPVRNKLNILINRANHAAYHIGQLTYLVKR